MDPLLDGIKLSILVFGPSPSAAAMPGYSGDLARKRIEIRAALKCDGHTAEFPEDLMVGSFDPKLCNAHLFEQHLVRQYDLVVSLVGSMGAAAELSLFFHGGLAQKVALYFDRDHMDKYPYQVAVVLRDMGATLATYVYPGDLAACNLMTVVRQKVRCAQISKYYS